MKFTLDNTPYIFNVFRNGNIWIKGFNDFSSALLYCVRYAQKHDNLIELWMKYRPSGESTIIRTWN